MRLLIVLGAAALLSLSSASTLSAQTVRQPGQLRASFELQPGEDVDPYPSRLDLKTSDPKTSDLKTADPKTTVATIDDPHDRFVNRLWIASLVSAVAGTSVDAASSWGLREGNGLLASSDGRFGGKGLGIKAGFAAAMIIPQFYLARHKSLKGAFTAGNFVEAAVYAGVSVHNFRVRNASQ